MASLATHFSNQNSGIIFSSVETNIGNFFDVMTGRFGAPVSGEMQISMNETIKKRKEGKKKRWGLFCRRSVEVFGTSD